MTESAELNDVEFVGLYVVPDGEHVAALRDLAGIQLYDKQGLSWRILKKRELGKSAKAEEQALARIRQLEDSGNGYF